MSACVEEEGVKDRILKILNGHTDEYPSSTMCSRIPTRYYEQIAGEIADLYEEQPMNEIEFTEEEAKKFDEWLVKQREKFFDYGDKPSFFTWLRWKIEEAIEKPLSFPCPGCGRELHNSAFDDKRYVCRNLFCPISAIEGCKNGDTEQALSDALNEVHRD